MNQVNGYTRYVSYPEYRKIPNGHPLDNNFLPVYIDKFDSPIKYHSTPHKRKHEVVIENTTKQIDLSKDQFTLEELLELDVTEIPFLVEKLIPKESITFIAGSSDVGKSLFYTQLALLLILDKKEFVGLKINSKHKRVIIVSTEDGAVAISSRIRKQLNGATIETSIRKRMIVLTTSTNLESRIEKLLKEQNTDLVVIDAFADVYGGDINTSNQVRAFLNNFTRLAREYKCAVLIVHHIGKGKEKQGASKSHLLGSVGIEGKARQVIILSQPDLHSSKRHLSIVKGNYVSVEDKKKTIVLDFDSKTLTYNKSEVMYKVGEDIPKQKQTKKGRKRDPELVAKARKLRNEGAKLEAIAKVVGKDKSTVSRWLNEPQYKVS
jgi:RecA-family ATPase